MMAMRSLIASALMAVCLADAACAQGVEALVRKSNALASQQRYDEALALLLARESTKPNDLMLKLAIARVLAWSGQYDAAEQRLQRMRPTERANADVMLFEADLAYYRGRPLEAMTVYQAILKKAPNYQDAKDGLQRARTASQAASAPPAPLASASAPLAPLASASAATSPTPSATQPATPNWLIASGTEYSSFDQDGRAPWRQYFVQVDRLREGTSPYARITHYDQYQLIDTEFEFGANWVDPARWNLNAGAAFVHLAHFKPMHRVYVNADYAITPGEGASPVVWATIQVRHDAYADGALVDTLNPGLAWIASPTLKLSANLITVDKTDAPRLYGRAMRVDITASDRLAWHVGYADAPEAELSTVVRTKTWFTGITFELGPQYTMRLGYTRDDRANAYIRQGTNASLAYRF